MLKGTYSDHRCYCCGAANQWRVVVRYDDPRGGTWRGPIEDRDAANKRLLEEAARVHGEVRIERVG